MGLFDWVDEIGTITGFALGGPGGAAIGRALGKAVEKGKDWKPIRDTLQGAAEGYAMGGIGQAMGLQNIATSAADKLGAGKYVADAIRARAAEQSAVALAGGGAANMATPLSPAGPGVTAPASMAGGGPMAAAPPMAGTSGAGGGAMARTAMAPMAARAPTPMVAGEMGGARTGLFGKAADFADKVGDFYSDPQRGTNRMMMTGLAMQGYGAYQGARQQDALLEEQRRRRRGQSRAASAILSRVMR